MEGLHLGNTFSASLYSLLLNLKQLCLLWGMSISAFESLVWVLQHKEFCPCGPLVQGLRGLVFLQEWSRGHQDKNLWGRGPGICISMLPGGEMLLLWDHALRTTCLGHEASGQHNLDLYSVFHLQTEF